MTAVINGDAAATMPARAADFVGAALAAHAAARPEAVALAVDGEAVTWQALHAAVEARAREIAALPPGGLALRLGNSVAFLVLFLAAARAGRETQVLDPAWPRATTARVRAALAPALLVSEIAEDAGEGALIVPPRLGFADLPRLAPPVPGPLASPDPESAFYVGFTSGSTGFPKGYRRSHRSWVRSFAAERVEFAIGPEDVVCAPAAFTHSLFLYAAIGGLEAGARVVALARFRPDLAARLIAEAGATVVYGVPTHYSLLIDHAAPRGETFPTLRLVQSSGAKWPPRQTAALRALAPRALFAEFYGASELSFVALARSDEPVPEGAVGRPFEGVRITIRDRSGRRLPTGRRGLVHVESDLTFIDYACGDDDGDACLRRGREVGVGDAGFLDAAGFLHLCGRWKRMIVTSGKNVFPEEIERIAERHPAVAAAAVLGLPDARRGERLVAVVALRDAAPSDAPTRAELVAHCRAALPLALVPMRWHRLETWPQTASGKTDFAAVARAFASGEGRELT